MKKIILSIAVMLGKSMLTSCGGLGTTSTTETAGTTTTNSNADLLGAILGAATGTSSSTAGNVTDVIGNIISVFGGGILTNQSSLIGTWTYTKPCVQFESDNLLAKAGGAAMATQVENKLSQYYQMVGIKQGACTFTFAQDGTLTYYISGVARTGSYTFDSSNKTVTIKTQTGQSVKAYVSISLNSLGLTFDSSKLLTLLGSASSVSSSLSSISSIASSFTGMKLGFEFSK